MAKDKNRYDLRSTNDRAVTGIVLVLVGAAILLKRMGFGLPDWLFDWPMILILVGIISGFRSQFKGLSWLIFLALGCFFMSDSIFENMEARRYIWPISIIGIGLIFLSRPRRRNMQNPKNCWPSDNASLVVEEGDVSAEDYINSTTVFGGAKKIITSKNFKGGEITCFMGGSEVNLSQADINGHVYLEVTMVFGGTKLVIPPHWEVRSESVAVFAGIEDKRALQPGSIFDPNKILIIRGTSVFGGIEIKSY
ncbi:MAG: cell wall-active antibiotics response protein [Chitinophagaceae bacterium]|jgi:predicted membrane protein|nr:cell wall-active antibiotics response protein [Chitinophagaceae bacterium]